MNGAIGLQPNLSCTERGKHEKINFGFIAAVLVTSLIAGVMFLIGQDAFGTSTTVSADTLAQYEQIVKQYQSLLEQLQSAGLITVASDGSVTANPTSQPGFLPQGEHHGGNH